LYDYAVKIDGRSLPHASLETIRLLAWKRVQAGEKPSTVGQSFGFCRTTIYRWLRAAGQGGEEALAARRATGRPCLLTEKQKTKVRAWISGRDPRQYGFDFGLWTRKVIADLIEKKLGVTMGVTAVGRLLAELDITPQKPLRRAYERDPEAIERWQREEFPAIRARAKKRGAKIFFLDEAGIRSDVPLGRTWAPRGKTPTVETSGQRQAVNAISAVNAAGEFWYEIYTERFNATLFLALLKSFMRRRRSPVFLVLDRHPAHIAKLIARYVQDQEGFLELHFLPGYAPDLNPDEFVWNHVKVHGISKRPLYKNESLRRRVEHDLAAIKAAPALVRSFFLAATVAYVTD
jgi:transposase